MSITNKAMIVNLHVSQWWGRAYDRKASNEINNINEAEHNAARVNKALVDKVFLEPITKEINKFKTNHYKMTLPWTDDGARILPSAMYFDYMKRVRELRYEIEKTIDQQLMEYDKEIENSRKRLGKLFNPYEYPSKEEIKRKFGIYINVYPIPTREDFRVTLSSDEEEEIKRNIEENVNKATEEAMKSLWDKLYASVSKVAERLSDPENKFKDSLINNLIEMCEILPKLNITGDANLENLRREVESRLCSYLPDSLRKNEAERSRAYEDAKKIMDTMSAYFS